MQKIAGDARSIDKARPRRNPCGASMTLTGAVGCVVVAASLVGVASAIAAPSSPGPASPGPPPTENQLADARQHYAAASRLYDLAEYEGALAEFKEAYRAVGDPAFLFNIAQCHRKLGHAQDAITFYKNYLRRAPNAANRAEVERRITELERAPAPPPPPPSGQPPPSETAGATPTVNLAANGAARVTPVDQALIAKPADSQTPAPQAETPFYRRGWFWIATGAVVAGTVATVLVMNSRTEPTRFCPDCAGTVVLPP
jgi:tetratricopeptide (TPR) repeat protein